MARRIKDEIQEMTMDEIAGIIGEQRQQLGHLKMIVFTKTHQIRHFRVRLLYIRKKIDYLLAHPFGNDTGTRVPKIPEEKKNDNER